MNDDSTLLKGTNCKCTSCGSELFFNPDTQGMKCRSCGNAYDFEKSMTEVHHPVRAPEGFSEHSQWMKEQKVITCQTCGANIIVTGLNMEEKCPYCSSTAVLEKKSLAGIKPDYVVPFAFTPQEATARFSSGIKHKFFVPGAFKKKLPDNKIHGIYVPSFLFDANSKSVYDGVLVKDEVHTNGKGGTTVRHKRFSVSGREELNFRNFIIESSTKLDDSQMSSMVPFDMSKKQDYDDKFLRGFQAEHYEDSVTACYSLAQKKMAGYIRRDILKRYDYTSVDYLNVSTNYSDELYSYSLLPVYILEYTYKGKAYRTYMNGQTGKVGKGLPRSAAKIIIIIVLLLLFVIFAAVLSFLSYMN